MLPKTSTHASPRETAELRTPDSGLQTLDLICSAGDITIQAAQAEGDGEVIPRFTMLAYRRQQRDHPAALHRTSPIVHELLDFAGDELAAAQV